MAIDALPKKIAFSKLPIASMSRRVQVVMQNPSYRKVFNLCVHFKSNLKLFVPIPFKTTATTVCGSQWLTPELFKQTFTANMYF